MNLAHSVCAHTRVVNLTDSVSIHAQDRHTVSRVRMYMYYPVLVGFLYRSVGEKTGLKVVYTVVACQKHASLIYLERCEFMHVLGFVREKRLFIRNLMNFVKRMSTF